MGFKTKEFFDTWGLYLVGAGALIGGFFVSSYKNSNVNYEDLLNTQNKKSQIYYQNDSERVVRIETDKGTLVDLIDHEKNNSLDVVIVNKDGKKIKFNNKNNPNIISKFQGEYSKYLRDMEILKKDYNPNP